MGSRIFTILAMAALLMAAVVTMYSVTLSMWIIGGVLVAGIALLIYRLKFPG